MKIVKGINFSIYVYANDHPPPHCHVRFKDDSEISVDIPLIIPRYGATINKQVARVIENNIDTICEAWEKLNPSNN